ncbi:MAG: HD domain-containing protein, partial [Deltaproteobacteria bacterium]|nr:HD domain-containing protein [Deltaproteobacteria bacterium]
ARCLAAQLGLDESLAEVAALAHDLGHPPFGHAGERALDECLEQHGGFEHNANSLRVVEYLEHPYPAFRGLNLTRVVRECLAKHETGFDKPGPHPLQDGKPAPPEGQVAALADRLTYCLHDLQDGLHARLIPPHALAASSLWRAAYDGPDPQADPNWIGHLRPAVDRMARRLRTAVAQANQRVQIDEAVERELDELEKLLVTNLYRHRKLQFEDERARRVICELFAAFEREPGRLPPRFAERIAQQSKQRVIGDYIAGMTDRFCFEEHERMTAPRS